MGQFVENNERLVDIRQGGYGYKDRQAPGMQRQRQQRFGNYRKFRPYHERAEQQRGGRGGESQPNTGRVVESSVTGSVGVQSRANVDFTWASKRK